MFTAFEYKEKTTQLSTTKLLVLTRLLIFHLLAYLESPLKKVYRPWIRDWTKAIAKCETDD